MDDIVKWLRSGTQVPNFEERQKAADLITFLRAELERLEADKVRLNEAYERAVSDTAELKALRATNKTLTQLLEDDEALRVELERKDAALRAWDDAVRVDVTMEGPRYIGVSSTLGKQAWERTRAALSAQKEAKNGTIPNH